MFQTFNDPKKKMLKEKTKNIVKEGECNQYFLMFPKYIFNCISNNKFRLSGVIHIVVCRLFEFGKSKMFLY